MEVSSNFAHLSEGYNGHFSFGMGVLEEGMGVEEEFVKSDLFKVVFGPEQLVGGLNRLRLAQSSGKLLTNPLALCFLYSMRWQSVFHYQKAWLGGCQKVQLTVLNPSLTGDHCLRLSILHDTLTTKKQL